MKIYSIFGLLILAILSHADDDIQTVTLYDVEGFNPKFKELAPFELTEAERFGGYGVSASLNTYVDNAVPTLVQFIEDNGLDPMSLPDQVEGFSYKPLWITYSALLYLTNGVCSNLKTLQRYDENHISYFARMLRTRLAFRVTNMDIFRGVIYYPALLELVPLYVADSYLRARSHAVFAVVSSRTNLLRHASFTYNYATKVMNIGPTGKIIGSITYIDIVADVLIDFNNNEIHLQELAFSDHGRLSIKLSGNFLTDWFVAPVVSVFTNLLSNTVIGLVEDNIRKEVQSYIDVINQGIKDTLAAM